MPIEPKGKRILLYWFKILEREKNNKFHEIRFNQLHNLPYIQLLVSSKKKVKVNLLLWPCNVPNS